MAEQSMVRIEAHKRLSDSALWRFQREYFDKQGIQAWANQVPFYVTSNPYIARCYAETVFAFIRDWTHQNPASAQEPFYVLELGTGSGRFSYYVVKQIVALLKEFNLSHVKLRYVMSDFTKNNLEFWQQQDALAPFVKEGIIDFAMYNMEETPNIQLINSGIHLTPGSIKNPLVIFGNYIFDTVSHDCFRVKNNQVQETLITLRTPRVNMEHNQVLNLEQLDVQHEDQTIDPANYYDDPDFNALIKHYQTKLKDSYVLLPISGLKTIRELLKISQVGGLLISSDKGYGDISELDRNGFPGVSFHGSFSLMVNFDAIAEYFTVRGGNAIVQSPRKGIRTMVGAYGLSLTEMPNTQRAIADYIEGLSPADYFLLHRRVSEGFNEYDAATLASHLALTGWDPHIFQKIHRKICDGLKTAGIQTATYLANNMDKIADNFYFMPGAHDTLFDIAIFYHTIQNYQKALEYYQKSQHYYGDQYSIHYNTGLCLYNLGQKEAALPRFKQALEIRPDSKEAAEWLAYIDKGEV